MTTEGNELTRKMAYLLNIIEVDREDRILCQAIGCGRQVHKRIHVVLVGTEFKVLGSQCYQRLYGSSDGAIQTPYYGSSEGQRLTDEERRLLIENTALFIDGLETGRAKMEQLAEAQITSRQRENDARVRIRQHLRDYQRSQRDWPSDTPCTTDPAYDISNLLNWKWKTMTSRDSTTTAYKDYPQQKPNFDIILQSLNEKTWVTPYIFSLYVEGKHFLPKGICLELLDKLGLVEQQLYTQHTRF